MLTTDGAHLAAIGRLVERLSIEGLNWALTGSLAHRLQGVDVSVDDVDVQTDEVSAYRAEQLLAPWSVEAVALKKSAAIESHFGRFRFSDLGVDVEVMGALRKRRDDGTWTEATDPAEHRRIVIVGDMRVPVLSLDYEAEAYELIGRTDRAALLRAAARAPRT